MYDLLYSKLIIWTALTQATLLESLRRKDLYVSLILAVVMIGAAATLGTVGVQGMETFLKDTVLTVVSLLSVIMAVLFSARQVPEEVERRTVYPLLARPIGRADFLIGKFCGAYVLSLVSLVLFAFIGWGTLFFYNMTVGGIFVQFLLLRAFALGIVCALTLLLSLFTTVGASVTVSLVVSLGASAATQAFLLFSGAAARTMNGLQQASYFTLPHLDLFDLGKKVSAGWQPIDPATVVSLGAYAAIYVFLFLAIGMWRFERKAL